MQWYIPLAQTTAPQTQQPVITTPPATQPKEPAPGWASSPLVPMAIIIVVMYFFLFRSKKTQEKKRIEMLDTLKKGDRIQTIGGIRGTVVDAREDEVVVKVDETSNTKLHFARSAIHKVLDEEKKS